MHSNSLRIKPEIMEKNQSFQKNNHIDLNI